MLISAAELAALLESAQQPVVADVRWTLGGPPGKPEYEAGHIPGAVWVDLESHLADPPGAGGRHPLPPVAVFEQAMRDIGVRQDSLSRCLRRCNVAGGGTLVVAVERRRTR